MPRLLVPIVVFVTLMAACTNKTPQTVSLANYPTLQQTTDYTCGCVSALTVMRYYGICDESESGLATKMHTHVDSHTPNSAPGSAVCLTDFGTSVAELYRYFAQRGDFNIVASSFCPYDSLSLLDDTSLVGALAVGNVKPQFDDYGEAALFFHRHLEAGRPIMVCWNLWGGHWTVCTGYYDNGTPDCYDDDLLTMADPYDSIDGHPDGFSQVSLVGFFYDWFCTMTPKPWQLQPYLIVEPSKE